MILITAATGHLGTAIIDSLINKGIPAGQIAALIRDEQKAAGLKQKGVALRKGDYFDEAALHKAFQGIDTLVFISSGTLHKRIDQHKNVINAAVAGGVQHIIYTSVVRPSATMKFIPGTDHYHTEEAIKLSGISYTMMRNTFYADILPAFLGNALETGQWYYAAGDAKANFAARADMAEAIANVAMQPTKHAHESYEITSSQAWSFHEIAAMVNKATGKTVNYIPIPVSALKEGMQKAGLSDEDIALYASVAESIEAGELAVTDNTLEKLLHRKPIDLKDFLPQLLKS